MAAAAAERGRGWTWATALLTAAAFGATIALAPRAGASPARALTWLLFLGSSVHVAATGWLFTLSDVRAHALAHPRRYVWAPLGLVALTAAAAALLAPSSFTWPLLAYFAWQFLHFQKQNLGLAALAACSARVRGLSPLERRALLATGAAGIAGIAAHPGLLQVTVGLGVGPAFPVAGSAYAVTAGIGAVALASRPRAARPAGFAFIYLGALLFFAPVFVFESPYAAVGALTAAHGLQYLLLIGLVARGVERGRARAHRIGALVGVALLGGAVLSAASHLHAAAPAGRLLFGAYLGTAMAHFVLDAGLWRLRDPFPRRWLSARIPYLVRPATTSANESVADRSLADIS